MEDGINPTSVAGQPAQMRRDVVRGRHYAGAPWSLWRPTDRPGTVRYGEPTMDERRTDWMPSVKEVGHLRGRESCRRADRVR